MKNGKVNSMRKYQYIIMWTYYGWVTSVDMISSSGKVEIVATDRETAEEEFYELNPPYIMGYDEDGKVIHNTEGGYVCECVLTRNEWLAEGAPEQL